MKTITTVDKNGVRVRCRRVKMPADGACLFSALSYVMGENTTMARTIRRSIVDYVVRHWDEFRLATVDEFLRPYTSAEEYAEDMLKPDTYGTACELTAAGRMFSYEIQLFSAKDGKIMAIYGAPKLGVKRLAFSGEYDCGHFDALMPVDEYDIDKILFYSAPYLGREEYAIVQLPGIGNQYGANENPRRIIDISKINPGGDDKRKTKKS